MTVTLLPMTQDDFAHYTSKSIQSYASEKVEAGTWTKEEAPEKSEKEFERLLPEGLDSEYQNLFAITKVDNDKKVGWLWYHFKPENPQKEAFIYDFLIFDEYQGQGYGKAALKALDDYALANGIEKISLHVFAHNKRAIHLYEKLNYEAKDLIMSKWLNEE
ncbi:GNAT family N-acetyltransferase [Virgibacillus phasianinus]|uniref:GNAT family N-acetyltransferase n=1 Tax=Virgibacillus phasianinus TaxID=2017483 RepID=A0A220TYX1_9BACI|nr:GNAT family N-acetyltransferase [Virgibacillus phasianinus]ASK61002.1 GNAT family N-acetyltransferase [Virgibacillus phasianinus]